MGERLDIAKEELEIYVEFYAAGTISTYLEWLRGDLSMSDDKLAQIISETAYYGLQKLLARPKDRK